MDQFRAAAAEFEATRRAAVASAVAYRPAGSLVTFPCQATMTQRSADSVDASGAVVTLRTATFYIAKADYQPEPQRGDTIEVTDAGQTIRYMVGSHSGNQAVWSWADPFEILRRITAFPVSRA